MNVCRSFAAWDMWLRTIWLYGTCVGTSDTWTVKHCWILKLAFQSKLVVMVQGYGQGLQRNPRVTCFG